MIFSSGGGIAYLQGGSVSGGAAGAAGGELAARAIMAEMYPGRSVESLSNDEKSNISALSTLAAGLAGGVAGNSLNAAGTEAVGGKVAVENNWLSDKDIKTFTEKYAAAKTDAEKEQLVADLKKLDVDHQKQVLSTGISIADQKTELEKLKQLAASPDCTGLCRELTNYSISQLEPVVNDTQLHKDNLTRAVLASTIIALTLEQPSKSGEKAPATGTSSVGKSTSTIDDIIKQDATKYFGQDRKYWSSEPVQFNGNKVYQRNDLFDPNLMTTWKESGKIITGTNLERMATGRAPIGSDGKSINLHHMTQKQSGPIAEVTQTFHQQNTAVIHINPNTIPSGINRAEFDKWKSQYWQDRASTYR